MKHFRTLTATLALAAVLVACSDHEAEMNTPDGRVPLNIHAGITTRAIDAKWQANDAIGIIMLNTETSVATDGKTNYKYITLDESGTFKPTDEENTAYFPTGRAQVDILAYYPYTTNVTPDRLSIPVDVSKQTNLPAIDLMTAAKITGLSSEKPDVALVFEHRLCKLILKVVTDETTKDVTLTGAKAVLTGTAVNGSWNLTDGKLVATGDSKDLALPMSADGTIATAIVMPTAAGTEKSITLTTAEGKSYIAEIDAGLALTAGTVNTYTMTLRRNQASITASIAPWTEGSTVSLNSLRIEMPADATVAGLNTFEMWRNQAQDTDSRTYTFDANASEGNGAWTATPHPYYIEEIASTDKFYALHTPADTDKDIKTGLKDLLAVGPAMPKAADGISLSFSHLMARLTPAIKASVGFPITDLSEATLSTPEMLKEYTLAYDGKDEALQTIAQTDGTKAAYDGLESARTYLFIPQTLPAGSTFTVTLGGKMYTAVATQAIDLKAGMNTQLTITLVPTQTAVSATVKEWEDTEIDTGDTALDDVTTGGSITLPAGVPGDFHLIALEGNQSLQSIYSWDGTSLSPGSTGPLSWDQLEKKEHDFRASFVPTATPTGNQERDYLTGSIADADFGTPLNFGELAHANAQLSVKLTSTDGTYTTEKLKAAIITVDVNKESLHQADATIALQDAQKTVTLTPEKDGSTAILAPQTISALHISIDRKPYTFNKEMELKAGTHTVATVNVKASAVAIEVNLAEWKTGSAEEGDVEIDK